MVTTISSSCAYEDVKLINLTDRGCAVMNTSGYSEIVNVNYNALLLLLIPLLTISGNVLVVASVYRERSLQTITNFFICSLAVSDFFIAACVMPFAVCVEVEAGQWNLSKLLCDLYIAGDVMGSTASILNLLAISVDRFLAVSKPLVYCRHKNHKRACITIGGVWTVSFLIATPLVFGINKPPMDNVTDTPEECVFTDAKYIVGSSAISFFLPCLIILFLYSNIIYKLHERHKWLRGRNHDVLYTNQETDGGELTEGCLKPVDLKPKHNGSRTTTTSSSDDSFAVVKENAAAFSGEFDGPLGADYVTETTVLKTTTTDIKHYPGPGLEYISDNSAEMESVKSIPNQTALLKHGSCPSDWIVEDIPFIDHGSGKFVQNDIAEKQRKENRSLPKNFRSPVSSNSPPVEQTPTLLEKPTFVFTDDSGETTNSPAVEGRTGFAKSRDLSRELFGRFKPLTKLHLKLRPSRSPVTNNNLAPPINTQRRWREHRRERKERKATQTLAIVVCVFLACWVPFFTCHVTNSICMIVSGLKCIGFMPFFITTWIGYMNSFMNPIIYTIFNPDFRKAFRKVLFCKR